VKCFGNGMEMTDKEKFWKTLREPSEKSCKNCKWRYDIKSVKLNEDGSECTSEDYDHIGDICEACTMNRHIRSNNDTSNVILPKWQWNNKH